MTNPGAYSNRFKKLEKMRLDNEVGGAADTSRERARELRRQSKKRREAFKRKEETRKLAEEEERQRALDERRAKQQQNNQGFKRAVSVQRQKKAAAIRRQDEAELRKWARAVTPDIAPYPPSYPRHQHTQDPYGSDPMAPVQMHRVREHERMLSDALSVVRGHWGTEDGEADTAAQGEGAAPPPSEPAAPEPPHSPHTHAYAAQSRHPRPPRARTANVHPQQHQEPPPPTAPGELAHRTHAPGHADQRRYPSPPAAHSTNTSSQPPAAQPPPSPPHHHHHHHPTHRHSHHHHHHHATAVPPPNPRHRQPGPPSQQSDDQALALEQQSYTQDSLHESDSSSGNESADSLGNESMDSRGNESTGSRGNESAGSLDSLADQSILEPDLEPMYEGQFFGPSGTAGDPLRQSRSAWGADAQLPAQAQRARPSSQQNGFRPATTQHSTTQHSTTQQVLSRERPGTQQLSTRPGTQQLVVEDASDAAHPPQRLHAHNPPSSGANASDVFRSKFKRHDAEDKPDGADIWDAWSQNQTNLRARQTPTDEDINYLWAAVRKGLDGQRRGTTAESSASRASERPPSRRSAQPMGGVISARPPSGARSLSATAVPRNDAPVRATSKPTGLPGPRTGLPRPMRVQTEKIPRPPTGAKSAVPAKVLTADDIPDSANEDDLVKLIETIDVRLESRGISNSAVPHDDKPKSEKGKPDWAGSTEAKPLRVPKPKKKRAVHPAMLCSVNDASAAIAAMMAANS